MTRRAMLIDLFAGAGGASSGLTEAAGREPDLAINHNAVALDMHEANHPSTLHLTEDIRVVDPREATQGRDVAGVWLSPSCTEHSNAVGKKPLRDEIRGLPWQAVDWAKAVRPGVMWLENVRQLLEWGPLLPNGRPDPNGKGTHFRRFLDALDGLGYRVEYKVLQAYRFGIPTIRERLFMVMRADGHEIRWPEETHGEGLLPVRQALEIIDWGNPVRSIFGRKKALAEGTLERIAHGVITRVLENPSPILCQPRWEGETAPGQGEVAGFILKHFQGHRGTPLTDPLGAVTTRDHHSLVTVKLRKGRSQEGDRCAAFVMKYYRDGGQWAGLDDPLHTITTKSRLALVCVRLAGYEVVDIGMRMLAPNELFAGQGFAPSFNHTIGASGRRFTQEQQIFCCGNSVPPKLAQLVASHNMPVH